MEIKETKGKVTFKGNPITLLGDEVKVGDVAKDFSLINDSLESVKLSDFKGKVVVIAVFPSIDTGVCQLQTTKFNQKIGKLSSDQVQLLTVSVDLPFALKRYCGANGIDNALTLSDHRELEFGLKYGFLIKELKLLSRGTVIVDKEGIVRYVEYLGEVANEPDYEKALAVVNDLINQ